MGHEEYRLQRCNMVLQVSQLSSLAHSTEKFLKYRSDLQTDLIREITTEYIRRNDLSFHIWSEIFEPETIEKSTYGNQNYQLVL
jgi:hypothetical protein